MNKKILTILIASLFILPTVFAISGPMELLRNMFGSSGYLVKWFGGDVVASGAVLLTYLRIGLFITLLTVLLHMLLQ